MNVVGVEKNFNPAHLIKEMLIAVNRINQCTGENKKVYRKIILHQNNSLYINEL